MSHGQVERTLFFNALYSAAASPRVGKKIIKPYTICQLYFTEGLDFNVNVVKIHPFMQCNI